MYLEFLFENKKSFHFSVETWNRNSVNTVLCVRSSKLAKTNQLNRKSLKSLCASPFYLLPDGNKDNTLLVTSQSLKEKFRLGLILDPVIKAIVEPKFEDGLKTGILPGGCWCHCGGQIKSRIDSESFLWSAWVLVALWLSYDILWDPDSNLFDSGLVL